MDFRFGDKVYYGTSRRPYVILQVDESGETELKYMIGRGDDILWVKEEDISPADE